MNRTLGSILGKPNDFKICENCNKVNWYENGSCFNCGSEEFRKDERKIKKEVKKEMELYEKEGYEPTTIETEV